MYGCETWSLTLAEERRLRVFEKRVLRRIFGPKRDEETGKWNKLLSEELNDLYYSPNKIQPQWVVTTGKQTNKQTNYSPNIVRVIKSKRMRWAKHVA
jgi:hypothetical protein